MKMEQLLWAAGDNKRGLFWKEDRWYLPAKRGKIKRYVGAGKRKEQALKATAYIIQFENKVPTIFQVTDTSMRLCSYSFIHMFGYVKRLFSLKMFFLQLCILDTFFSPLNASADSCSFLFSFFFLSSSFYLPFLYLSYLHMIN